MSWKKNAFSYLIWFVYTVLIGVGLMGVADFLCTEMGLPLPWYGTDGGPRPPGDGYGGL